MTNKEDRKIKKRLVYLAELIRIHNYNYHTLDSPKISDKEFDKLVIENDNIEKKYPHLVLKNSPNKNYGSKLKENFVKIVKKNYRVINS